MEVIVELEAIYTSLLEIEHEELCTCQIVGKLKKKNDKTTVETKWHEI